MTDIVYDTEFRAIGGIIDLIFLGAVNRTTGERFYRVNADADYETISRAATRNTAWLCENVIPHLPLVVPIAKVRNGYNFHLDLTHPDVVSRTQFAEDWRNFILGTDNPRLCAWYGAYDHVAQASLFGTMSDMPGGVPWWTWDLKQWEETEGKRHGITHRMLPAGTGNAHNALDDAIELAGWMNYLEEHGFVL